jgi:hypothetical protein
MRVILKVPVSTHSCCVRREARQPPPAFAEPLGYR